MLRTVNAGMTYKNARAAVDESEIRIMRMTCWIVDILPWGHCMSLKSPSVLEDLVKRLVFTETSSPIFGTGNEASPPRWQFGAASELKPDGMVVEDHAPGSITQTIYLYAQAVAGNLFTPMGFSLLNAVTRSISDYYSPLHFQMLHEAMLLLSWSYRSQFLQLPLNPVEQWTQDLLSLGVEQLRSLLRIRWPEQLPLSCSIASTQNVAPGENPMLAEIYRALSDGVVPSAIPLGNAGAKSLKLALAHHETISALNYGPSGDSLVTDAAAPVVVIVCFRTAPPSISVVAKSRFSMHAPQHITAGTTYKLDDGESHLSYNTIFGNPNNSAYGERWWIELVNPYIPTLPIDDIRNALATLSGCRPNIFPPLQDQQPRGPTDHSNHRPHPDSR